MEENKYKYPTTSTHKIHSFIDEFGEGKDKVLMMRRLKSLRSFILKEVGREYEYALKKAKQSSEIMY